MTRYAELKALLGDVLAGFIPDLRQHTNELHDCCPEVLDTIDEWQERLEREYAALALPEDSKTVNAELYKEMQMWADENVRQEIDICNEYSRLGLPLDEGDMARVDRIIRYLSLREASGEPMLYKVIREGDKVRFL